MATRESSARMACQIPPEVKCIKVCQRVWAFGGFELGRRTGRLKKYKSNHPKNDKIK